MNATRWIFVLTSVAAILLVACLGLIFRLADSMREPMDAPPIIPLDSPCPACGNRGCTLQYDPENKNVKRTCIACNCTVTQPPVAPGLFKK